MDLGQDSPVSCLHCHQSFCSRSTRATGTSRTSFGLPVSCFCFRTFVLSSWSWAVPDVGAFLKKTPADDFVSPSANCPRVGTHIKPERFVSLPTAAEHLSRRCHSQRRPSIIRYTCVFGQTVEQALTVSSHSDREVLLRPFVKQNPCSNPHFTQHGLCAFCLVKGVPTGTGLGPESRQGGSFRRLALPGHEGYWDGFGFIKIVLINPHRPRPRVENEHGHPSVLPLPTTHRLTLVRRYRRRHCEGLSIFFTREAKTSNQFSG